MKKYLPLLLVALYACTKNPPAIPDPANAPEVSAVPAEFEQKIVIESFTQTTCGQCPKAHLILDSLVNSNPDRVYGVSIHISDIMSAGELISPFSLRNVIDSLFNPSAIYPSGMVNRMISSPADLSPGQWPYKTLTTLGQNPSCGIAIEASDIVGETLSVSVHTGFSQNLFGDYRIHAYLVENPVRKLDSLYSQMNDFSFNGITPDSTLSLYYEEDTIVNYSHNYVLRRVINPGGTKGIPIPSSAMYKGNDYVVHFDVDLTGINTSAMSILVFVDKYATNGLGHWIENAQIVPVGEAKDWN